MMTGSASSRKPAAGTVSVLETIKKRRSIRHFTDRNIPDSAIDALIEAVRWAPSAGNLQSRKFYFVFNENAKKNLARTSGNPDAAAQLKRLVKTVLDRHFVSQAPLVVVACLDRRISLRYGDRGVSLYGVQDVAASVMNMMLTAHELGLGSVWVGAFREEEVAKCLGLPDHLRPVALIPIGYPASIPSAPIRMEKDDVAVMVM